MQIVIGAFMTAIRLSMSLIKRVFLSQELVSLFIRL